MPIFEYKCNQCGRKFSLLVGVVAGETAVTCPKCGSENVNKLMSRFSTGRSTDDAFDNIPEPSDPDDPKALREWMRNMGDEMGEDFEEEFDELMSDESDEGLDDVL